MAKLRTNAVRAAFCVAVAGALSFGTSQAFAGAYPVSEGDYCTTNIDRYNCFQGCAERYGEGTQATCARQPGSAFPVCICIR